MKECSGFGSLAENFLLCEHRLSLRGSEATEAISRLLRSFSVARNDIFSSEV